MSDEVNLKMKEKVPGQIVKVTKPPQNLPGTPHHGDSKTAGNVVKSQTVRRGHGENLVRSFRNIAE
jgi:hypothetical protein